jgi:hypothetical protein
MRISQEGVYYFPTLSVKTVRYINLQGLIPRTNDTDRATAACRRS